MRAKLSKTESRRIRRPASRAESTFDSETRESWIEGERSEPRPARPIKSTAGATFRADFTPIKIVLVAAIVGLDGRDGAAATRGPMNAPVP